MLKIINKVLMAFLGGRSSRSKDYQNKSLPLISLALHRWVEERGYCNQDADMNEVARHLGISKERLSSYCLNVLGKSFLTWRKELRIAEAKRMMLEDASASISKVAEAVGLDRANFRRQFYESLGCGPQEWREKHLCNK